MIFARRWFTAVYSATLHLICVIGGHDDNGVMKACEFYSLSQDKWSPMKDLNVARHLATASVYNSKTIYVFSGRNKDDEITDKIEVCKDTTGDWQIVDVDQKAWVPCWNSGSYQIAPTKIFIFGGFN